MANLMFGSSRLPLCNFVTDCCLPSSVDAFRWVIQVAFTRSAGWQSISKQRDKLTLSLLAGLFPWLWQANVISFNPHLPWIRNYV